MISKIKDTLFNNKNATQAVFKNTFWLATGRISGQALRAILVIYAARVLGPASWGAFSYVLTLAAFLLIFTDMGLTAIVTKESSKNHEMGRSYFSTALLLKLMLISLGVLLILIVMPYLTKIEEAKMLLPVIALMLVFDSLRNFGFSLSRSNQEMQKEAANEILTNSFITVIGIYFLAVAPNSYNLSFAYLIGTMIGFIFTIVNYKNHFFQAINHFDNKLIKPLLAASLPFAMASCLGAIMINTDLIMLGWMVPADQVGFYSAAQKPIQMLYVVAALFATSLFPILSNTFSDKKRFGAILEKAIATSILFAIPLAIGGIILSNQIIVLLFRDVYLPATATFQILCLTFLIIYPSSIISNALLASNEQKNLIKFSTLGALGNIFFNILLIPILGIAGAALSTVATQIIANSFIWRKMSTVVEINVMGKIKKIIISSLLIIPLLLLLKYLEINVIINILTTCLFYFLLLKIQKEEIINQLFKRIS